MKINRSSQSYIEWKEYSKLIWQKEYENFIDSTARESLRNLMSKEAEP